MFDDQNNNANNLPPNLPTEPVDMFAEVDKDKGVIDPQSNIEAVAPASTPPPPNALEAGMLKKKEADSPPSPIMPPTNITAVPASMPSLEAQLPMYATKGPVLGKIIMFLLLAVLLGGVGFGGWWVYAHYIANPTADAIPADFAVENKEANNNEAAAVTSGQQESTVGNEPSSTVVEDVASKMSNDQILFGEPIDTDKDGLDDVREKEIGTDLNKSDSDEDGLIDGDEVIIWKTDPLKPDSDGDSYVDGKEVRNGYNPLGPGKLFNVEPPTTTPAATNTANTSIAGNATTTATTTDSNSKAATTTKTTSTKKPAAAKK